MAPFVSKLLSPPPSHAASTWRYHLVPRATVASLSPSPAGRRIAPPQCARTLPHRACSRSPATRCASASSDRAGSTTTATDLAAADEEVEEEIDGLPFVQMSSDMLQTELILLKADSAGGEPPSPLGITTTTALENGDGEDARLSTGGGGGERETAAYPAAMNALYAACLAGNVTEQLWNFTWPAAIATLHPTTLLPVAVLGFFSKLVVFAAGPLVGELVSSLPRISAYRSLTVIQTAAHLVSAAMLTYAFTFTAARGRAPCPCPSASALLLQPWFAALVASTAVDRLSLGVIAERDFVVRLAGEGRPIALARANAALSRVDLLCETAGASIFAVLLSRNDAVTCVRLSCAISLCALPLLLFLAGALNGLADGIFDDRSASDSERSGGRRRRHGRSTSTATAAVGGEGEAWWASIRRGWTEYLGQPVLPASLAYVLVCFNVALAPGALMTTFLIHHGASASVLGAFGGSSAAVGILATFLTPHLVKELGILKAGAAGLVAQSALLGAAVVVFFLAGNGHVSLSRRGTLFAFLGFIVASRLGQMAYSVIGLQLVQTGNPMGKAKLIGATEIAVASLAELAMMAVAAVAGDAAHFGCLAALSAASVAAAACLFCAWLANATDQLRRLFPC